MADSGLVPRPNFLSALCRHKPSFVGRQRRSEEVGTSCSLQLLHGMIFDAFSSRQASTCSLRPLCHRPALRCKLHPTTSSQRARSPPATQATTRAEVFPATSGPSATRRGTRATQAHSKKPPSPTCPPSYSNKREEPRGSDDTRYEHHKNVN